MFDRIKNAFELKGGLNGLKMILGAALLVLSHELLLVKDLIPMFPSVDVLNTVAEYMQKAIDLLSKVIGFLGDGFLGLGFLDKIRKLFGK